MAYVWSTDDHSFINTKKGKDEQFWTYGFKGLNKYGKIQGGCMFFSITSFEFDPFDP